MALSCKYIITGTNNIKNITTRNSIHLLYLYLKEIISKYNMEEEESGEYSEHSERSEHRSPHCYRGCKKTYQVSQSSAKRTAPIAKASIPSKATEKYNFHLLIITESDK